MPIGYIEKTSRSIMRHTGHALVMYKIQLHNGKSPFSILEPITFSKINGCRDDRSTQARTGGEGWRVFRPPKTAPHRVIFRACSVLVESMKGRTGLTCAPARASNPICYDPYTTDHAHQYACHAEPEPCNGGSWTRSTAPLERG